jgi:tetratricopeptide (TPR) repeat protein
MVTPVAAAQLVLFWNMATATLFSPVRAAQTIELLAPLLGAYLCSHALAPEQAGVQELVFVRPVSLEKVLLVRLAAMFAFVLAVLVPALVIYQFGIKAFPLGLTLLAGLPSMLFLSILAMAIASATRNPLIGLGVAAAFWVLDLAAGTYFNPIITLHSYADSVASRPMAISDQWVLSKLLMLVLAGLLYLWNRRLLRQPAGPRRWVTAARVSGMALLLILAYLGSGAAYKLSYGLRHEREFGYRAHLWYKQQFGAYGPLPIPRLFGPAFALYIRPGALRGGTLAWAGTVFPDQKEIAAMKQLLQRYPNSIWADNAAFEISRAISRDPAPEPWLVTTYYAEARDPVSEPVDLNLLGAIASYQRFVDRYPASPFAPIALEQSAVLACSLLDFRTATESYQRLLRQYPRDRESREAGLALSALYLREGRWQEAVRAADVAAAAAPWDLRAEALLAAAQAAERGGDGAGARGRYQQAHAAAKTARHGATAHWRRESGLSGGQIVLRSDAVMRACEEALARGPKSFSPAPPPPGVEVRGRVTRGERGVAGVRVALGVDADPSGRVSPFLQTPAAQGVTGADGSFLLRAVQPGSYRVAAFAQVQAKRGPVLQVNRPPLPVEVGTSPLLLPELRLAPRAGPRPGRATPPGPAGQGQAAPGGQRGEAGTRGGAIRGGLTRAGGRGGAGSGRGGRTREVFGGEAQGRPQRGRVAGGGGRGGFR